MHQAHKYTRYIIGELPPVFVVSGIGYGGWPSYLPANLVMFGSQADNIQGGSFETVVPMTEDHLQGQVRLPPSIFTISIFFFCFFKSPTCNCYNFDTTLRSDLNFNWVD